MNERFKDFDETECYVLLKSLLAYHQTPKSDEKHNASNRLIQEVIKQIATNYSNSALQSE